MARREWADKLADAQTCPQCAEQYGMGDNGDIVHAPSVARLLRKEHARAVRIVKKKIRSLEACIASDKRDGNEAGATLHVYALSILNSTLADMQKGRA